MYSTFTVSVEASEIVSHILKLGYATMAAAMLFFMLTKNMTLSRSQMSSVISIVVMVSALLLQVGVPYELTIVSQQVIYGVMLTATAMMTQRAAGRRRLTPRAEPPTIAPRLPREAGFFQGGRPSHPPHLIRIGPRRDDAISGTASVGKVLVT